MHPRLIWAIARKDALDLWKNKSAMGGLLAPIILSLVYLLLGKVIGSVTDTILVYNPGNSGVEQVVESAFSSLTITGARSAEEVAAAFNGGPDGSYSLGLVVPADFDASLRSGNHPEVQVYYDGNKVGRQTQALIQAAVNNYSRNIADPQPPMDLSTTVLNQSPATSVDFQLSKFYAPLSLLVSFIVGITFVPQLLLEEKEKKTLRMLMVSPASFLDMLIGKLLVVLVYQFILSGVVLGIQSAFTGQVWLVVLYAVLGGLFSMAVGLLIGSVFNTVSAASAAEGPVMIIYIIAGIFTGQLGQMLGNSPVVQIARFLPTYYIADGVWNATQDLATLGNSLLDISIILGSTILLLAISAWVLRRQSAVAALI